MGEVRYTELEWKKKSRYSGFWIDCVTNTEKNDSTYTNHITSCARLFPGLQQQEKVRTAYDV